MIHVNLLSIVGYNQQILRFKRSNIRNLSSNFESSLSKKKEREDETMRVESKYSAFHSYSKRKPHFNSSYHQISKILRSQHHRVSTSCHKIFAHFLFQAQNRTLTHLIIKIFENSPESSLNISPPRNIHIPFLFQAGTGTSTRSPNLIAKFQKIIPFSRVEVSTSPSLSRTSKYSHGFLFQTGNRASPLPPTILGFYNNRARSNMSRYARVPGSNSRLSILRHV